MLRMLIPVSTRGIAFQVKTERTNFLINHLKFGFIFTEDNANDTEENETNGKGDTGRK